MVQTAEVRFPSPDDLAQAPLWENYVVAQASAACLGLIPSTALAVGVEIDGARILLRFRLTGVAEGDREDMTDVADELSDLLGPAVQVNHAYEVASEPGLKPDDGVWWIFRSRTD